MPERAKLALDALAGLEPELKAAAVISDDGEVLATTTGDASWGEAAVRLMEALEKAGTGELDSSHITTEDAEVFMVREEGLALVAVTARFVLASLTSFDVRMSLRGIQAETGGKGESRA
jgi:predicted regulator of Ras-like GTPase activity (Roadblock/LC7/MglB family)